MAAQAPSLGNAQLRADPLFAVNGALPTTLQPAAAAGLLQ